MRAGCRGLLGDSGGAVVELAVVLSFLGVPLLLGTTDIAQLVYSSIEVSDAAHAGAMYGMTSQASASQTAQITTAAQNDASDFGASLIVTPTAYFACASDEGGTQYPGTVAGEAAAVAACTGGDNHALEFIQVSVSAPVTLPFACCGIPNPMTLSSTSVMEVEDMP